MKTERRIVAYGDSLTKGHFKMPTEGALRTRYLPYTYFLKPLVSRYLRERRNPLSVYIENVSEDGMAVGRNGFYIFSFGQSLEIPVSDVLDLEPDACIVLGGTNNLGILLSADSDAERVANAIAGDLFAVYTTLKEADVEPVSVTIPPVVVSPEQRKDFRFLVEGRQRLNDRIKEYSIRNGINCADLFAATATEDGWMRGEYANDGLHFNPKGYFAMAEAIFDQGVKPILDAWLGEDRNRRGILGRMRIGR